jgi:hypothetical protein
MPFHCHCFVGFSRDLPNEMAYRLLRTFHDVYASWWSTRDEQRPIKKRSQTRLIQLIYDLRFVHMLLERKDNSIVRSSFERSVRNNVDVFSFR